LKSGALLKEGRKGYLEKEFSSISSYQTSRVTVGERILLSLTQSKMSCLDSCTYSLIL
jgi:hypothetical protein